MDEPIDIEVIRTEALKKLGRNIINFSKIESGLKYLLAFSQFEETEETISEQFHRNLAKRHKQKQTLGSLVHEFNKNVVVDASPVETKTAASSSGISFYLKVIYDDPDFLKAQKLALSNIVLERNKLIHEDLAFLEPNCAEDYCNLIKLLDEQNPRLGAQLEKLGWIIDSMSNPFESSQADA